MKDKFLIGMIVFYLMGSVSGFALHIHLSEKVSEPEDWMLCFDAPSTQETFCGSHRFESIDGCVDMRDWLHDIIQNTWGHTDQAVRNHRCNRVKEK